MPAHIKHEGSHLNPKPERVASRMGGSPYEPIAHRVKPRIGEPGSPVHKNPIGSAGTKLPKGATAARQIQGVEPRDTPRFSEEPKSAIAQPRAEIITRDTPRNKTMNELKGA